MTSRKPSTSFMIAVDGSQHAERAFSYYYGKLHRPGNSVKVVHAAEVPSRTTYTYNGTIPPMTVSESEWQKVLADHMEHIKILEEKYQGMCAKKEPPCEVETVHTSHPGAGLIHYAQDHKIDQVVIGTRGTNTFRRTFLGSVSDYVLHHLHKPITVVPSP